MKTDLQTGFFRKDLCAVLPSYDTIRKTNLLPVYFERYLFYWNSYKELEKPHSN